MPESALFTLFLILGAVWLFRQLPMPAQVQTVIVVVALIGLAWLALRHFVGVG